MDAQDAIRRVRLLEKSVRLLLEAVSADVVTTTIVPAGRARYLGVNYFSRPPTRCSAFWLACSR